MEGHTAKNDYTSPLPHEYVADADIPANVSILFASRLASTGTKH